VKYTFWTKRFGVSTQDQFLYFWVNKVGPLCLSSQLRTGPLAIGENFWRLDGAMRDFATAITKIKSIYNSMSVTDKRLAQYVIDNYREIAFASTARVGRSVKVSPPTVIRFAKHLGLSGYSELQELARRALRQEVDTVSQLERISPKSTARSLFHEAIHADVRNLEQVSESITDGMFARAVKSLSSAQTIHVIGLRSIFGLAHHFVYLLREIGRQAQLLHPGTGDVPEQLMDISTKDVCIAISFKRYTRDTVSLFRLAKDRGANTITITDTEISPLTQYADIALIVPVNSPAFFESRVGALSVMSALGLAVANETRAETLDALRRREAVWAKYQAHEAPAVRSRYEEAVERFSSSDKKLGVARGRSPKLTSKGNLKK
jgi:DNA-binding MurR/RpiR family transcriptional regulator